MSISTAPLLLSAREAGVLTLTLNRPEVLNGLTDEVLDAVAEGCREAAGDDSIRVVVITGAGRGFCSGQDLRAGVEAGDADIRSHGSPSRTSELGTMRLSDSWSGETHGGLRHCCA